jgi:ATP-dependent RNA helicase SUPV3L1/SUV3
MSNSLWTADFIVHSSSGFIGRRRNFCELSSSHGTGVYLAPLGLLALEGQKEIARQGRMASLLTGKEREIVPCAGFIASIIEMLGLHKPVDCALIGEVQKFVVERCAVHRR